MNSASKVELITAAVMFFWFCSAMYGESGLWRANIRLRKLAPVRIPLKQRLRTGTVVTNDDRNWELRFTQKRKRINLSRAVAVDMESGTIAAQGFRLRVPYGTLLCVSDKPLHGEIKLPGAASAFYETAVAQHLKIGLAALDLLKERRDSLHSRKLRSFDEPPFR